VVLLLVRSSLPPDSGWWLWTCTAGLVMGLFALWYVPFLKSKRARAAAMKSKDTGPAEPQSSSEPESGYVSRDSGSNTVSSTDTPGSSTRT
jgi:hypothetical protein